MSLPATRTCAKCFLGEQHGRVAEWLKAPDSKSGVVARLPWVRIPPLPPFRDLLIVNGMAKPEEAGASESAS